MKNYDILNLVNGGIFAVTANDLDASQAYKVLKFKKAVKKAFDNIAESEKSLLAEVGIEDAQAFDKEREELTKSGENAERLAELDKTLERYLGLRKNLYDEEVTLEGIKTIPYETFHELQKENRELSNKPLNVFDSLVLWVAPEEE